MNTNWKKKNINCKTSPRSPHMFAHQANLPHTCTASQPHTHTHTRSWLTCLPLATSQSHAPFMLVWNVGAAVVPGFPHFSVNDTEAGSTKEVCPIKQRLSDQSPPPHLSQHTHTPRNTVLSTGLPGTPSGQILLFCQPIKHGRRSPWELEWLK